MPRSRLYRLRQPASSKLRSQAPSPHRLPVQGVSADLLPRVGTLDKQRRHRRRVASSQTDPLDRAPDSIKPTQDALTQTDPLPRGRPQRSPASGERIPCHPPIPPRSPPVTSARRRPLPQISPRRLSTSQPTCRIALLAGRSPPQIRRSHPGSPRPTGANADSPPATPARLVVCLPAYADRATCLLAELPIAPRQLRVRSIKLLIRLGQRSRLAP